MVKGKANRRRRGTTRTKGRGIRSVEYVDRRASFISLILDSWQKLHRNASANGNRDDGHRSPPRPTPRAAGSGTCHNRGQGQSWEELLRSRRLLLYNLLVINFNLPLVFSSFLSPDPSAIFLCTSESV